MLDNAHMCNVEENHVNNVQQKPFIYMQNRGVEIEAQGRKLK